MFSEYNAPLLYRNPHLAAIIPNRLRKVNLGVAKRITINTPDDDFLDIDFFNKKNRRLAILVHGLEGSSQSTYIKGMAKQLLADEFDIACMNMRGCSGRPNHQFSSYHSGKTDDLDTVIQHFESSYEVIVLIGFSLGGNMVLKYAGEQSEQLNSSVKSVVGISVPLDLAGSCDTLSLSHNWIYLNRFLTQLKAKAKRKAKDFPAFGLDPNKLDHVKDFRDFDDLYTAPAHGFENAADYYAKCSAMQFLNQIQIPALIVNAEDDTFLSESCYPTKSELNERITYLTPKYGGHVGFAQDFLMRKPFWSETTVSSFLQSALSS